MLFKDIIGQKEVKRHLLLEVRENRIPHAQLFCGPEGSGKLALAIAYARYINCRRPDENDACGTCPSCVKFNKLAHPDLHFVFPVIKKDPRTDTVSDDFISEWRQMLEQTPYFNLGDWMTVISAERRLQPQISVKESNDPLRKKRRLQPQIFVKESNELLRKLSLKSSEGGYKTVIMWLPEKLNTECANKLLKLLEEPPAQTVFILVSDNPEQILPTILSRTQRIQIPRLTSENIIAGLTGRFGIQKEDAADIARASNGNYILAMQTIRLNEEKRLFLEYFIRLMRLAYMKNVKDLKKWSENIAAMELEQQKRFLEYSQHMIRENFILNFHRDELNYMNREERDFSVRFSPFINERNVIKLMNELTEAQVHIEQNVNAGMVFFDLTLKTIMILKQ